MNDHVVNSLAAVWMNDIISLLGGNHMKERIKEWDLR